MLSHPSNPSLHHQPWGHPLDNKPTGLVDHPSHSPPASKQLSPPAATSTAKHVIDLTASESSEHHPPPAKRPRLEADAKKAASLTRPSGSFQALVSDVGDGGPRDAAQSPPPPLPPVPWECTPPDSPASGRNNSKHESRVSSVGEVQTTPYHIEPPSSAPAIKGNSKLKSTQNFYCLLSYTHGILEIADFFPWTGNHPEDVLDEETAKQGYYDRPRPAQQESNTARLSLYSQMKHQTDLHLLSSVFAAALEKRKEHDTISAPSTFKPPPRVTLTDNRREAWLRDLANAAVPLRRLSRTIPHGIRGKVLLDQCLNKHVPVSRAVWLAKCVGANEIRAFKRRGTSGAAALGLEAKWVRDWTTNVQQFVEAVVNACGSGEDWKVKMTYVVNLATRLFSECLLDHNYHLDWFISCLETASIGVFPVWLAMLGIYWDSILRFRKRGRRLAEILLEKRQTLASCKEADSVQPVVLRLSRCIKKLVRDSTSSVVLPDTWEGYRSTVVACMDPDDQIDKAVLQTLSERNARVQRMRDGPRSSGQRSRRQYAISLFDSIRTTQDINSICSVCVDAFHDDMASLVATLLEWTASSFRHGVFRVFAAVRFLRRWKVSGIVDVDSHILAFLADQQVDDVDNIYHVVSELVRSQTFSVGRYLQWLVAKGAVDGSNKKNKISADVGLIAQLPASRLPEHVCNLRSTLMGRVGLSTAEEEAAITQRVKDHISQDLHSVYDGQQPSGPVSVHGLRALPKVEDLSWAVKSEIGQWIRRGVMEHYRDDLVATTTSALTPEEFYRIREILETCQDLSILADVLKHAADSDDSIVLASAADTVNYHFESFCAIGATVDLFRRFIQAYSRLKSKSSSMGNVDLVFSLIELGLRMPAEFNVVTLLRQDLSRMDHGGKMVAAPTPVSDSTGEMLESILSSREKLDQLFSNTTMDETTLSTIFSTLINHLFEPSQGELSASDTCRYLARLRLFQPKCFDLLLVRWVCSVIKSSGRPALNTFLPPLVGVGCVTIQAFISLLKSLLRQCDDVPDMVGLRMGLLDLVTPVKRRDFDLVCAFLCPRYPVFHFSFMMSGSIDL